MRFRRRTRALSGFDDSPSRILYESTEYLAASLVTYINPRQSNAGVDLSANLEEWVSSDNTQESLQALTPCLNDLIREAVGEDLSGKRGDIDTGGFTL